MKLILLRHGETEDNVKRIIQGHLPGKLTENGILQAQKAGKRLENEKIDVIYSSDLHRTKETTAEILKFQQNVQVHYTEEIREIDMGDYSGKTMEELNWNKNFKEKYIPPKNGESTEQLYDRIEKFIKSLVEKHSEETVLCVTHGGTIKAFVSVLKGIDKAKVFSVEHVKNTSVSIFEVGVDLENKQIIFNDNSHLD